MSRRRRWWWCAALACAAALAPGGSAAAAPQSPRGPHPRIALTPAVLATLKGDASEAMDAVVRECEKAPTAAGSPSGYQGFDWAVGASACALAWNVTRKPAYAERGARLWRALLEDVVRMGDRQACVAGAGEQQAIAAIKRDTGYAIRFIGLHTALAYDWLHDAPGVDEALRKQSRDCFRHWITFYTREGYHRREAGANYHAGYAIAKTLIAVAEAGEDGAAGDRIWTETVDDLFGQQIVADGLAAASGGKPSGEHGVLVGGDWAEGWQYGPLSVLEYALAARALAEQGVAWPEIGAWLDDVVVRFMHGLTPGRKGMYVGGDCEDDHPYIAPSAGPLLAALIGPSSDRTAAWAAHLRGDLGLSHYGPTIFDALGAARRVTPADPMQVARSPWFVAAGTRNVYARSSWAPDAYWAVFTSPPRVVSDHMHLSASSFVFSRGEDALVVDPTPYGSRSSLSGNALTVDSDVVLGEYKPSQTPWGRAELTWVRGTPAGVVAARADVAGAFKFQDNASDVPLARRDWVFLPEGEVVVVDRAVTGSARRGAYIRFRTLAALTSSAERGQVLARGTVGRSAIAIHALTLRPPATPLLSAVPKGECNGPFGACRDARFAVNEYALKIAGPEVLAVHVIDGLADGEAPAQAVPLLAEAGVAGASVVRASTQTFVLASPGGDGRATPPELATYTVAGAGPARHVVLDAPAGADGRTWVAAAPSADGRCTVSLSAASGAAAVPARPAIFRLGPAASGCPVSEEPAPAPPRGATAAGDQTRGRTGAGCGCRLAGLPLEAASPPSLLTALFVLAAARRRRPSGSAAPDRR